MTKARLELDVVSDIICPWCFIGATRVQQALAELPEIEPELAYHPFLLDPTVPPEGVDLRERLRKKYGQAPEGMFDRVEAAARDTGLAIDYKKIHRTPNTIAGHTLIRHAGARGTQSALAMALFRAYFLDGKDVGQVEVLADIAAAHGFSPDEARSLATDPDELAKTRTEAAGWAREGISGVPFTIVGKKLAVSGAQSLDVFVSAMKRAVAEA